MNCPECGHPAEEHVSLIGCIFQTEDKNGEPLMDCECSASRAEIECDAWKAEALAARAWIEWLEYDEYGAMAEMILSRRNERKAYFAARVQEDVTQVPPTSGE